MDPVIAPIVMAVMLVGCLVASQKFYGGARMFLYGCAALNLFAFVMILLNGLH